MDKHILHSRGCAGIMTKLFLKIVINTAAIYTHLKVGITPTKAAVFDEEKTTT